MPYYTNSLGYIRSQQLVNNIQSMVIKKRKETVFGCGSYMYPWNDIVWLIWVSFYYFQNSEITLFTPQQYWYQELHDGNSRR
jgi:hypothetical protein